MSLQSHAGTRPAGAGAPHRALHSYDLSHLTDLAGDGPRYITPYRDDAAAPLNGNPLANLIDSIGSEHFAANLLLVLNDLWDAQSYSLHVYDEGRMASRSFTCFHGSDSVLSEATKLGLDSWRRDGEFFAHSYRSGLSGRERVTFKHKDLRDDEELRELYRRTGWREQLIICGGCRSRSMRVLSVHRMTPPAPLPADKIKTVGASAQILFSILTKHEDTCAAQANGLALSSVNDILVRVARTKVGLSPRAIEVCARILYGMTTGGIALDLGIGKESVIEYRKRLYRRLEVSSQHELLKWYLSSP